MSQFTVVKNNEDQYSIWPDAKPLPDGWTAQDFSGDREACLAHIESVWTDMRPKSLREKMDG